MKKYFKLILINILVILGLLLLLNFSAILIFKGYKLVQTYNDPRINLPNYKNTDWAATHFKEFSNLPTEYRSYVGWRRLPYKGKTIDIDENGIRVTPQSDKVKSSSPLVVFIGGSAMWGTGSDDKNTIPAKLSTLANGEYRTLNLAETGYNAFQGFLYLKIKTMEGLRPDIIVSYDGVNEIDALDPSVKPFSHTRENQIKKVMQNQDRNADLSFSHFFLQPLKLFIGKIKLKLRSKVKGENAIASDYLIDNDRVTQVAKGLLDSWQSTKDLAEKTGADFLGILQPNIYMGNPRRDYLVIDESMKAKYQALYSEILRLLKEPAYANLNPYILDLTSAFDGDDYIYIDDIHVSPNGNSIIAEKIYNSLKDN